MVRGIGLSRKLPDDICPHGVPNLSGIAKGGTTELMIGRKRGRALIRKILRMQETASPEPVPVAQTRYDRWTTRVMDGQLDFWGENWADLSGTQQYAD
jgi:hypothetical protein